ncbi:Serine/threonine-protein phosphatase [Mycena venus]|uniref:Serine/threonine-protein phosphatase n=1 Tax=Mycena venus TaxID=2733690 RepID=A0A8H7D399_9AGAR|nr:Serine/threonine-protein phosphatase [Mycena venus]
MAPFDLDACIQQLLRKRLLHETVLREICAKTKEVLMRESNVVHVSAPITVVGDIHGQFYDLIEIFRIGGFAPSTNYLFLGDYVDRGLFSVETMSLLMCLKLRYPNRVQLIRGNHESRAVTQNYGFYTECMRKYGSSQVWTYFTDMFDLLALSCVIDDRIFCVHGGLSPSIHSIDQIKVMDRFREVPHDGPMADLLWQDPVSFEIDAADLMAYSRSDPDAEKEDFAISPRSGERVLLSARASSINFSKSTICLISCALINCAWRDIPQCLTGISGQYGPHRTIVSFLLFSCAIAETAYAGYRCGNSASILEVGPGQSMYFNVFGPAPENERDGPSQQAAQSMNGQVKFNHWLREES